MRPESTRGVTKPPWLAWACERKPIGDITRTRSCHMVSQLTVESVEREDKQYRVQFRDADAVDELVSPDWARELADEELSDADVLMGKDESGDWLVQSILVPRDAVDSEEDASRKGIEVVTEISERDHPD